MYGTEPDLTPFGARAFAAPAGARLFGPGDACKGFISLNAGRIRVTMVSQAGREILLYRVTPGQVCLQTFACLVQGRTYTADGVAESDLDGMMLSPDAYGRALNGSAPFRNTVMASVAQRFAEFEELVSAVAFLPFEVRLARALLANVVRGRVMMTHEALAEEAASSRAVVSRQLGRWSQSGLVNLERGCIVLLDPDQFTQIAQR